MTTVSLREAIDMGLKHHMAGELVQAESIYVQIIETYPTQPEPIHLLGVIALQRGNYDSAIQLINRAIDLQPRDPRFHSNLGQAYAAKGMHEDAINAHRRALSISPDLPEALNNLGNALLEVGRSEDAVTVYQRALRNRPNFIEAHNNLGNAYRGCGKFNEAIASYEKSLSLKPDYADALSNLGALLTDTGKLDAGLAAIRKAVALNANAAEYQNNLCTVLRLKKDISGAIEAARRAVELRPDHFQAFCGLGVALLDNGQVDAAIEAFVQSITIRPDFAEAYSNLGNAFRIKGDAQGALEAYRRAIEVRPNYADAHANLGKMLHTLDRYEEAIDSCRRALELRPGFVDALSDLGTSLANVGRVDEAIDCYRTAASQATEDATVRYNYGLSMLLTGDYRTGWPECEWRWSAPELQMPYPKFPTPRWDGLNLNGKHLLLFAEQGFGDAIQFSRFAALAAKMGGPVSLVCQPELVRLIRTLDGIAQVTSIGERMPMHDVHYALLSLPLVFDTTVETIPAATGYLRPDPADLVTWQDRLKPYEGALKVGLVWAGRRDPDPKRAIPPEMLSVLGKADGVRLFSLQRSGPSAQPVPPPPGLELVDLMSDSRDFADTAALIANLDLVITVDTAVAHLAGALGKPVWVLLPFLPDWRWMLRREDSPWYSSARLFRQPARADWQTPIDRLVESLEERSRQ